MLQSLAQVAAFRRVLVAAVALGLGACAGVPSQSGGMQTAPSVIGSADLIQLQAFETGRAISTMIESAADSIQAVSTDPVVRRNALLLKISAIPLVQEAALRTDPLIAAADLLAFTIQFAEYLTSGAGKDSFGPEQPIAVAAAAAAERAARSLADRNVKDGQVSPEFDSAVRTWAAAHPMQGPAIRRASLLSSDWKALGVSSSSLAAAVGNIERTLLNVNYRLSYLNETLAAQARWNAELAAQDALAAPRIDSLLVTGTTTLRSVGALADTMPGWLDWERAALMRDIDRQRILAFADIAAQRLALQEALDEERAGLMSQVRDERVAAFLSIDSVVTRTMDRSAAVLHRLLLEVALAALFVVTVLLLGGFVLFTRWRDAARAPGVPS